MAASWDAKIMGERGKALEEAFFAHHEKKLIERMRQAAEEKSTREGLAAASGIQDEGVLDTLASHGLSAETVAALGLVPLVEVAWADGTVQTKEHQAVLEAAEEAGVADGSPARELLDDWLAERPPAKLLTAWESYVGALAAALEPAEREALRQDLIRRATRVAEAAGGILGMNKISAAEQRMIDEMDKAFGE